MDVDGRWMAKVRETDETTRALSNAAAAAKNNAAMLDVIHDGLKFLGKMIMFYDRQIKFLQSFRELAEVHGAPKQWSKLGAKEIVEALLSVPNRDLSNSPLHTACAVGGLDAIKWLLKYGGNKHMENDEGLDPVSMLCAYHSARMEKVRGQSSLEAQMLKDEAECFNVLIDEGRFSIDHIDMTGMQPLHFAAKNGAKQLVTMLLDRGADPFRTPAMNLATNAGSKGTIKSKYANMKPSQIAKKERHMAVFVMLDELESKVTEEHQREVDKVFPEKDCEPTAEEKARLAEIEKRKAREADEDRRKAQEAEEEEAKRRSEEAKTQAIEEAKQREAEESKRKLKQAWEAAEKMRAADKEKFKKEAEELKRQTKDSELAKRRVREAEEAKRKAKEAEEAKRRAKEAEVAKQRAKEAEEAKRKAKEVEEAKRKAKEAEEAKRKAKEAEAAKLHSENSSQRANDGSPPTVLSNESSRSQSISDLDDIIPPQLVQYAVEHGPYTLTENDTDSSPSASAAKMLRRQRYGTGVIGFFY